MQSNTRLTIQTSYHLNWALREMRLQTIFVRQNNPPERANIIKIIHKIYAIKSKRNVPYRFSHLPFKFVDRDDVCTYKVVRNTCTYQLNDTRHFLPSDFSDVITAIHQSLITLGQQNHNGMHIMKTRCLKLYFHSG